jgi:hypothetical protein
MGDRTSRTSPDMSILSVGLTTGQDKTPPYKGVCLSVVLSNARKTKNLKNIPAAPRDRPRSVDIAANSPRIGKVERAIRRQLILSKQLTTTELARRIYSATKYWQVGNVRRAAPKFAVECGRRRSAGAPIVWKLRD